MTPLGDVITLALVTLIKTWLATLPPEQENLIGDQLGLA